MYGRQRQFRRQGAMDYVMPFLILVCVGIILVLVWNLWTALFGQPTARAAYLHIVEGSAEMKTWNTDAYFNLSTDVVVRQGDEIRTANTSKIVVEFFDGTLMRLGGGSDVRFEALDDGDDDAEIEVKLLDGALWFNRVYKDTADTELTVVLKNVTVQAQAAGIFEVEDDDGQVVRVFDVFEQEGALVEILDVEGKKVVEEENVGVGQEIVFTKKVLERYWQFQSPSVLAAVSDEFKLTDWYKWNAAEDAKPTVFEKLAGENNGGLVKAPPQEVVEPQDGVEPQEGEKKLASGESELVPTDGSVAEPEPKVVESLSPTTPTTKPTILSVANVKTPNENGFYVVTSRVATLTGNVSGADKVVVNGYTLQKFKVGDGTWTYFANADFNLMKEGENIYEVYALDSAGNKSESLTVKVLYQPSQQLAPAPVANEPEPSTTEASGDQEVNLDAGETTEAPTD